MKFKDAFRSVSSLCFAVSLWVFIILNEYLMPTYIANSRLLSLVASFVAAAGVYPFVFQTLFWIYSKFLYKFLNPRFDLNGTWYQVISIHDAKLNQEVIRHGPCAIDVDLDRVQMSGQNFRLDYARAESSIWQSTAASYYNRQLQILYKSEGVNRPDNLRTTHGLMQFHIMGDPPSLIQGTFHDVFPATNSGIITIYRNKQEYEKRLQALLPKKSKNAR